MNKLDWWRFFSSPPLSESYAAVWGFIVVSPNSIWKRHSTYVTRNRDLEAEIWTTMVTSLFSLSLHISNPPINDEIHPSPDGTPLMRLVNETLENSVYQSVCIPITNAKWAERWKKMCLSSETGPSVQPEKDVFSVAEDPTIQVENTTALMDPVKVEAHRLSETWRAGTSGRFQRDEVNLTRIGE